MYILILYVFLTLGSKHRPEQDRLKTLFKGQALALAVHQEVGVAAVRISLRTLFILIWIIRDESIMFSAFYRSAYNAKALLVHL